MALGSLLALGADPEEIGRQLQSMGLSETGAAWIRALAEQSGFPRMTLSRAGYGSGKNHYGIPSLLRAVLGEKG